jgi:hypothetical protein
MRGSYASVVTADLLSDAARAVETLDHAARALRESPLRRGSLLRLPAAGRLLVTGDLHDDPDRLRRIAALARLDASPDRHVVLHEIIHGERLVNGVDLSHRMLLRVAALIVEHPLQVHLLLANHELAQLSGTGVSKGAGDSVALFDEGLRYAFGERSGEIAAAIGRLIRAMPLALRSDSGLLCAHSLPGRLSGFDPGILERDLAPPDYEGPRGSAYMMVWGRGWGEAQTLELASRWDVRLFCLGHRKVESGIERCGELAVVINSDGEHGAALPVDLSRIPSADEAPFLAVRLRGDPV